MLTNRGTKQVEIGAFEIVSFVYVWLLATIALIASKRLFVVAASDNRSEPTILRGRIFIVMFVVMMLALSTKDLVAGAILG